MSLALRFRSLAEALQAVRARETKQYTVLDSIPLDNAATDRPYEISGSYLFAISGTQGANVRVRLNETSADQIPLIVGRGLRSAFHRFYLSWPAQAGRTITLVIANELDVLEIQEPTALTGTIDSRITFVTDKSAVQYVVGTVPVLILAPHSGRREVFVKNTGTTNIYLGGGDVAVSTGFELRPGEGIVIDRLTSPLHAVSDSAGGVASVFATNE